MCIYTLLSTSPNKLKGRLYKMREMSIVTRFRVSEMSHQLLTCITIVFVQVSPNSPSMDFFTISQRLFVSQTMKYKYAL